MPVNHTLCVVLRDCWHPHVFFATMLRVALLSLRAFAIFYADLGVPFVQISSASPARTKKNRNKEHLCLRTNCAHGCSIVFPEAFPVRAPFTPPRPRRVAICLGDTEVSGQTRLGPGGGSLNPQPGRNRYPVYPAMPEPFSGEALWFLDPSRARGGRNLYCTGHC